MRVLVQHVHILYNCTVFACCALRCLAVICIFSWHQLTHDQHGCIVSVMVVDFQLIVVVFRCSGPLMHKHRNKLLPANEYTNPTTSDGIHNASICGLLFFVGFKLFFGRVIRAPTMFESCIQHCMNTRVGRSLNTMAGYAHTSIYLFFLIRCDRVGP